MRNMQRLSVDLDASHPAVAARRIAEPWGVGPGFPMGWLCGVCRHVERTDGPGVAAPIPAPKAAHRHNLHRHPRRLAQIESTKAPINSCRRRKAFLLDWSVIR